MDRKVLITAGPTREPIDPVRYISNRSSGKTGYIIADTFVKKGFKVKLVTGPVSLSRNPLMETIDVETAQEMRDAVIDNLEWADIIVLTAAVADYKPSKLSKSKIKKNASTLNIELQKNPDILKEIGESKREGQFVIGFALETENLIENAHKKLVEKNTDLVIANDESAIDADIADIYIIERNKHRKLTQISKKKLADIIVDRFEADFWC